VQQTAKWPHSLVVVGISVFFKHCANEQATSASQQASKRKECTLTVLRNWAAMPFQLALNDKNPALIDASSSAMTVLVSSW
jgi:hypothetical protein